MTLEEFNDLYFNPHSRFGIDTFQLYETYLLFKECLEPLTSDNIFFTSNRDLIITKKDFFVIIPLNDIKSHDTYKLLKILLNMSQEQKWLITQFNKDKNLLINPQLIDKIKLLTNEQINEIVDVVKFLTQSKATLLNCTGKVITYQFENNYCAIVYNLNLINVEQSLQTFYIIQNTIQKLKFDEIIGKQL